MQRLTLTRAILADVFAEFTRNAVAVLPETLIDDDLTLTLHRDATGQLTASVRSRPVLVSSDRAMMSTLVDELFR